MELDDRKITILHAIIQTYLDTGEPVGSRTISKFPDLSLSSATIRNEMADLEEMGYIFQPHTSAGRIPTDKGYRFYVDNMMRVREAEEAGSGSMIVEKVDRLEQVLKQVVKMLAVNTNYASLITAPQADRSKMRFIQLSLVGEGQVLAVVMLEGKLIKHKVIPVDEDITEQDVVKINLLLNSSLQGLSLGEINLDMIQEIKRSAGEHRETVSRIIDMIVDTIQEQETEIYTSGTTNLLKYPELGDREKTGLLLNALEEKQGLNELIARDGNEDRHPIQVYIGSESPVQSMQDCSIVTATYELDEGLKGTIGIIGPKRMDYRKVVDNLETVMHQLDSIFKKDKDGQE
ncbi:MAG: heat-inducible transcriptional repressor HrcA [Lachnospiraceae bacterium]|nr:heat-inducible transcriptional repressor HrcA [Lachnospiraceae bacterium]